ncbi:DUF4249 domain-containing protein [Flavitalea sp. BT771]|uniref:DUF4249 domain-containing protein n=1 Tax=Flavitalea sp. BT771 TaxID=3063329 RepID=UPI0026E312F3|nr:DUF4249 domain-containing protein [Flavitalea sp. BT771]MDO6430612.1 DUF4249 domain-containing protein [Flavitalea sp. BT771]MDV6219248.1 DUF4249 domain-containing protein [Flavitalea sp. BT771]
MTIKSTYTARLLILLLATGGPACKRTIQVQLDDAPSRIVIEGDITNEAGPHLVKITRTVNFSDLNTFPPVTGAAVQISDSTGGLSYALTEASPGRYETSAFTGKPGHTYSLVVQADGQQYTAVSTMPALVPLDSVSFALNTDFNGKKDLNAVVNFQDPSGIVNYYQFIEYLNGKMIPNTFVFEDRLSDGRYIEQPLFNDSAYLKRGDTLQLKMYCIDRNIYNYFFSLLQVTANNGFQAATPNNPITNLTGGALGYFSAHTVNRAKLAIY